MSPNRSEQQAYTGPLGPSDVGLLLAFRLLCEAAKVVEDENNKRKAKGERTSNTAEFSGMTIHAPKDLSAWLAPFDKSKPEDIPVVARLIGSGDVNKAAEAVLNAVANKTELKGLIEEFLKLSTTKNS